ncbi:MAG: D-Ala-D-Ala carboxypeptidase family metallohydrolase [Sphingomicrobium sp.]|nr:hypothetical protein [Sphingomonadales bacterium]
MRLNDPAGELALAARLGARFGAVTSTFRTVAHNRAVGGVPNSYHLRGQAIDIARRPGVSHLAIDAAYRHAGFRLIESLDEGDHSHLAFLTASEALLAAHGIAIGSTNWRIVEAPAGVPTQAAAAVPKHTLRADDHGTLEPVPVLRSDVGVVRR